MRRLRERAAAAPDCETLLGIEGEGAGRYFSTLVHAFSGEIRFAARRRRPPPDPANALLSLGYVLLANRIAGLLEARGLDPYLGFLHRPRSGRPALALDMMEEFRHPVVDRFVLRLCNRRQVRPACFETDLRTCGVRLTKSGLRRFLRAWEGFLDARMAGLGEDLSVEEAMRRQADRLAAHLRGNEPYVAAMLAAAR